MLLRQIKYLQSVVRHGSFTEAAEECHISQSAISQQIKALEHELGVQLLERHNRTFSLTRAGEYFCDKTRNVIMELDKICEDTYRISSSDEASLTIGYLNSYGSAELQNCISEFVMQYPKLKISIMNGTHEELYDALRTGRADLVLNDQRRAFSQDYVNMVLAESKMHIQISVNNSLIKGNSVDIEDLKDTPCILVASVKQRDNEIAYYRDVIGILSEFVFVNNMQEARMMVAAGNGYMVFDGLENGDYYDSAVKLMPLTKRGNIINRTYCAFWKVDNSGYYVETFAELLKAQFEKHL